MALYLFSMRWALKKPLSSATKSGASETMLSAFTVTLSAGPPAAAEPLGATDPAAAAPPLLELHETAASSAAAQAKPMTLDLARERVFLIVATLPTIRRSGVARATSRL